MNRRLNGAFLHFNGGAVGAVGVLRTSPPTSVLTGTDDRGGGHRCHPDARPVLSRRDLVKVHGVKIRLICHSAP